MYRVLGKLVNAYFIKNGTENLYILLVSMFG